MDGFRLNQPAVSNLYRQMKIRKESPCIGIGRNCFVRHMRPRDKDALYNTILDKQAPQFSAECLGISPKPHAYPIFRPVQFWRRCRCPRPSLKSCPPVPSFCSDRFSLLGYTQVYEWFNTLSFALYSSKHPNIVLTQVETHAITSCFKAVTNRHPKSSDTFFFSLQADGAAASSPYPYIPVP